MVSASLLWVRRFYVLGQEEGGGGTLEWLGTTPNQVAIYSKIDITTPNHAIR